MKNIVLFDGVCNMCNASVQFIIKRDPKQRLSFASLQSDFGQKMLSKYHLDKDIDSVVFIDGRGRIHGESTAALRVARQLKGGWKLLAVFLIVPPALRNVIYRIIARNRYRWFGKKSECMIPTAEQKERFLD
ncbi:thiol-disulfide oxidoreductase [Salipaludibacillus keqinensis]|uniref:Thiol-disulfide oxidoreductase n=1 Tax=Salipaludibacillus keqinensis TaxID=2045207 RepID=A0A323TJU0_9BACI|nr:thiol-disulfide oxidoreductase DCC family protein [Salipaludibacillus keqinensis]PYZ95148.1 thiol-disulfide oxidoreductase [Salipaludibacillus keqinensis]